MAKGILSGMAWGAVGGTALLTVLSLYTPMAGEKAKPALSEAGDTADIVVPDPVEQAKAPSVQSTAVDVALSAPVESTPVETTVIADAKPNLPSSSTPIEAPLEQEVEFTRPENPDDPVMPIVTAQAPQELLVPEESGAGSVPSAVPTPTESADAPSVLSQPAPEITPSAGDAPEPPLEVAQLENPALQEPEETLSEVNETPTQEAAKPRIVFPSFDNATQEDETQVAADAGATEASSNTPIVLQVPNTENQATGVVVNRLPSLRTPDTVEPETEDAEVAPADKSGLGALQAFATDVDVTGANALVGVVLIHTGADGVPAEELVQLELPFSVAIDPSEPGAKDAAATYRAAGIEVLAMVNDLPEAAEPTDIAVAMEGYWGVLEEAVAVLDPLDARIQSNRALLEEVLAELVQTGHGLVTYDRGLNTAQQTARRQNIAAATVFRLLDGDLETAPKIKRYLGRAAFSAAQDGSVVVMGRAYPETVKGLVEWALDGKGADVSVVPVSKIMLEDVAG